MAANSEKWAVVTGSSSGIGRAIALELARTNLHVVTHGFHQPEGAASTAEEIRRLGLQSEPILADLCDTAQIADLRDRAWRNRHVAVWINAAGADVLTGENGRLTFDEKLRLLWKTDVLATIQLSRMVGRKMKSQGTGTIINMGWDQAEWGQAGDSGELFAATKGAIMAFTKSLAKSLAPEVRVNCLAPGWIKTKWGDSASEYWQERAIRESLLGRWGTPEDVARVTRFLVSPDAEFLTGQIFQVNGGWAGYPAPDESWS